MRRARRICLLGLSAIALAAVFGLVAGTLGVPSASAQTPQQPRDESKTCNPVLQSANGTPDATVIGSKSFTLPLFASGPTTCAVQLLRAAAPCDLLQNACADGNVLISLTTPGSAAVISCPLVSGATTVGPTTVSGGSASCQSQTGGTSLLLPCGVTASQPAASTTVSNTCTGVAFQIQSVLTGCINNPTTTQTCPLGSNAWNLAAGTATVTVTFFATPANGGRVGGILLGTNTFTFPTPGTGLLLVTATPQLIPSNGTIASAITATFACEPLVGSTPFPLSATNVVGLPVPSNQGILGTPDAAVCGGGLAGTFTFAGPSRILFDNGRSTESVNCGLGANQNAFSGPNPVNPNNLNPTAPLALTCTGAAVLAIGAGSAGNAPINVTYTSATGGLMAVGSTLLTVAPSGTPVMSIACNPPNVAAGGPGSLCTAHVTDPNGIPLSGLTGATVTFTSSDSTRVNVLACGIDLSSNYISIDPKNLSIPVLSPVTPCQEPTGQVPAQNNTFLNGQAVAMVVANGNAAPGTVTISATLMALIPPSVACILAPYLPTPFNPNTTTYGLPGVTGCGYGNPIGFTGIATALSTGRGALTGNALVTLPNSASASAAVTVGPSTAFQVMGATATRPLTLPAGCDQVVVMSQSGASIKRLVQLVTNGGAVQSIWRYNNATKRLEAGYFNDGSAPTDFSITGVRGIAPLPGNLGASPLLYNPVTESYFVCVNALTGINPN